MIPVCYSQNNALHRPKTAIDSSKLSPRHGPQNNKKPGFLEKNREKQGRTGETGAHQTVSSASQLNLSTGVGPSTFRQVRWSGRSLWAGIYAVSGRSTGAFRTPVSAR